MPKLYAVLLGGRAAGCNTELHDVVFVAANSLAEAYPQLVNKWFGVQKRLHIDASIELHYVDGYEITLQKEKPDNNGKVLYFVNFGGYKSGYFGEIHESTFYVAPTKTEALARAKKELCLPFSEQHCDDNLDVAGLTNTTQTDTDDIIKIEQVDHYYLHLRPTTQLQKLTIEAYYRRLD